MFHKSKWPALPSAAILALSIGSGAAQAQDSNGVRAHVTVSPMTAKQVVVATPAPPTMVDLSALTKPVAAITFDKKPVRDVAEALTKQTGIMVLSDSSAAAVPITFSASAISITEVVSGMAKLVPGTMVRLVAVSQNEPAPDADLLSQMLRLQDALHPLKLTAGTTAKTETLTEIEIAGRRVPLDTAGAVLATLKMQPALLLTNPTGDNITAKYARMQAEGLQAYLAMTPEQRLQAAEQQMNSLFNMDSGSRRALFGQMQGQTAAIMKKIDTLPTEQKKQFWRDLTNDKWDGTMPTKPAPPAGGGN